MKVSKKECVPLFQLYANLRVETALLWTLPLLQPQGLVKNEVALGKEDAINI